MKEFIDSLGRSWQISFNIPLAKDVREKTGFELQSAFENKVAEQLAQDMILQAEILMAVLDAQIREKGLQSEEVLSQFVLTDIQAGLQHLLMDYAEWLGQDNDTIQRFFSRGQERLDQLRSKRLSDEDIDALLDQALNTNGEVQ